METRSDQRMNGGIEDRQAGDRSRAEANAPRRKRREWEAQGRAHQREYPEPAITINATRRWSGNQGRGAGNERTGITRKYLLGELPEEESEK